MPRANRILKGNKRRAVFDRLIVPENGFHMPEPIRQLEPDLPTQPVGQRCMILNVKIYEISISYEGKPQKFVKTIPFSEIVGNPISEERIEAGYEFTTPQGETLLVKWYDPDSHREHQGLIVHNKNATGTSYYEPNWGQVYGVGLEWVSCDGSQGGTIWANRHIGFTKTLTNGEIGTFLYPTTQSPEYSPNAVRGGLMLGNPEPDRTIWLMGQELPMRVYPALGKIGYGCIFGFNENVVKFVTVRPPIPSILYFAGAGTARGDAVAVRWNKDEFITGYSVIGMQILEDTGNLIKKIHPSFTPNSEGVMIISDPTTKIDGTAKLNMIEFDRGAGIVRIRLMLLECDAGGNPTSVIKCNENVWVWAEGAATCPYYQEPCSEPLPYPLRPVTACVWETEQGQPNDPDPTEPTGEITYFCDNSVPVSTINTDYWVGERELSQATKDYILSQYGITIRPGFWEGRNDWLDLFQKMDGSTPFSRSKITITDFNKFLTKMLTDLKNGSGPLIDFSSWQDFKNYYSSNGMSCLSDLQMASIYCSNKLIVPVNFFPSAAEYLQGNILDVLVDSLSQLPRGIYDWIDFNDVIQDSGTSITGAFATDIANINYKALRSFVNFEPQALQFGIASAKAHRPVDYVKLPGSQWGATTAVDYSQYWLNDMTDSNYQPYVASEVGIHEIGHAVSFFGLDFYGQVLHERPDWLSISGWTTSSFSPDDVSKHLSKSKSSDQTGGMPLTDEGKEAPVSDYGCFHPSEDFAEAFRMYIINPIFLEAKHPEKYAFMINVVENMFSQGSE